MSLPTAGQFYNARLRIERVVLLAAAFSDGGGGGASFEDFAEGADSSDLREIFGDLPKDVCETWDDGENDLFIEWLTDERMTGVLIEAATPVFMANGRISWAYYHTQWIYAESLEEAVDRAFRWAKERYDEGLAKLEVKPEFPRMTAKLKP